MFMFSKRKISIVLALNTLIGLCSAQNPFITHPDVEPVLDWDKVNPFRRSICVDYLYYNEDGTIKEVIPTKEGVEAIKNNE